MDLRGLGDRPSLAEIHQRLAARRIQAEDETWSGFQVLLGEQGAIVEAFIEKDIHDPNPGKMARSPCTEGYIHLDGSVEMFSTHDQILGGTRWTMFPRW